MAPSHPPAEGVLLSVAAAKQSAAACNLIQLASHFTVSHHSSVEVVQSPLRVRSPSHLSPRTHAASIYPYLRVKTSPNAVLPKYPVFPNSCSYRIIRNREREGMAQTHSPSNSNSRTTISHTWTCSVYRSGSAR